MLSRIASVLCLLFLTACQLPSSQHTLATAEVIRIAEAKARSFRPDIARYEHWLPPQYDARYNSWWVAFRVKHTRYAQFWVRVEAKTGKAYIAVE
jgi:hypothetical protein